MSESVGRNGGGTGMGEGLGGGHRVLVLGPGPLSPETGTAPAYASWKTARLLSEEGFEVVGMDPSDTSLLTLPGCCSRFYPEPLAAESVEAVLEKESPGFLAGYSTGAGGMFLCARLFRSGALKRNGCEMLGPSLQAIHRTQDRALFKEVLMDADLYIPRFVSVLSLQDGIKAMHRVGFPLVVRPHYSSGGRGSARACNLEEYLEKLMTALRQSPLREVTVEEDLSGWREFICVAARDRHGEKAFLGAIEQLEPAGANGGDSMWVFPAASLGKELSYFLEEACGKIADVLDIRGVLEVEVLIHPRLEEVCVSEAHPGPGQSALFMCFAAGCDTAGLDLLLSLGYGLDDSLGRVRGEKLGAAVRIPYRGQGTGTAGVPLDMERSSVGEWVVGGGSMQEAARRARRLLEGGEKTRQAATPEGGESLMMMPPDAKLAAFWREGREPDRLARRLLPEWFERFLEHGRTEAPATPLLLRPSGPEAPRREGKAGVLLLGGEPHHPARGADGDINAVQALLALRDLGREPLAYGENPLLARLAISLGMEAALGPLDPDSIIACARETGSDGVFTQYGGEASLALTRELTDRGCAVPGLSAEMLSFRGSYLREQRLFIEGAPLIVAEEEVDSLERALEWAEEVGYPHVAYTRAARGSARTSIVYGPDDLRSFYIEKVEPQGGRLTMRPLYEDGVVVLAELLALPERVVLLGLAQNLEDAGAAADDCMLSAPPLTLTREQSERVGEFARQTARELGLLGNLRMRIALLDEQPRLEEIYLGASPTLPFVSLVRGRPAQGLGVRAALGLPVAEEELSLQRGVMTLRRTVLPPRMAGEEDILPVSDRRTVGSLVGLGPDLGAAFAKAYMRELDSLQGRGAIFISVANRDKRAAVMMMKEMASLGFSILATSGTAEALRRGGMEVADVKKLREGRPNVLDLIKNGEVDLIVNTPRGKGPRADGFYIRSAAARYGIPCITDMHAATLLVEALAARREGRIAYCDIGGYRGEMGMEEG